MKIRFISKKEREELKQKKETEVINNNTSQHKVQQNGKRDNNEKMIDEAVQRRFKQKNRTIMQRSDQDKSDNEQLQRSREKRVLPKTELNKQEKNERKQMKDKYLGLIKPTRTLRFDEDYKEKLLFQWDNSQDTSKGVLNQYGQDGLKKYEQKFVNKNDMELGKTWKQKSYEQMTERDWRIFREDNQIFIKGGRVAIPFRSWDENPHLNLNLVKNLKKLKFQKPKPIQMQSIPIGIEEKDMVAIAPTGQGKTLGFLIPALHHVQSFERLNATNCDNGPYVIILVPSRQLAQQIQDQFLRITYNGITAARVVGGVQLDFQALQISKGCDILIGTPGRIKEMVEKYYLSLARCSWAIIDEADKMISQNLGEDVQWILDSLGSNSCYTRQQHGKTRVTHMFSATMVPQIEKLTKKYLSAPVFVTIGQVGGGKKQIQQYVEFLNETQKNDALGRILRGLPAPIIIFVSQRTKCEKLCKTIEVRFGRTCSEYHGGKSQQARQSIIQRFRQGKFEILVATDLGGRGLDIKGISAAISYDAPKNISEFVHRAGRSGRAGIKGKAFTFLTNDDEQIFYDVKNFLQRNDFKVPQQLKNHPAAQMKPGSFALISRRKQIVYTN